MAALSRTPIIPTTGLGSKPGSSAGSSSLQEFSIRVPKTSKKKYQVMRFNSTLGVNFTEWKTQGTQVKMERENNMKEFRGTEEEIPKFGAGSEFGKEAREEARRKKFGIVSKKYRPEAQPWILKTGGKNGKKFKGIREGGVSDNTAYYVFTQAGKGVIEAYPLQEWYKFQPIQRYKALSAEEAEEEFGRRNKIINYFSVMVKKRLKGEEEGDPEELEEIKGKKGGSKKKDKSELKISEMDDWVDSDDDNSGSDDDEKKKDDDDDDADGKKKKKKNIKGMIAAAKKKKKKKDSDDEAFEESDDGDEEGRELDYISDSSESASDHEMKANKELKGVAEEDALRKLLNSESEDEDEEEEEKKKKEENASNSDDDDKKKDGADKDGGDKNKDESAKKKKKKKDTKSKKTKSDKKSNGAKKDDEESSSELSPNSTDTDSDAPAGSSKTKTPGKTNDSRNSSRSNTPVPGEKRKLTAAETAVAATKKAKLESPGGSTSSYVPSGSETGVTEDAVRRYLMRKPMTTSELVQKFKSKKTGLSSEQLVNLMALILKNINPVKQTIKNKMYLSIKPT